MSDLSWLPAKAPPTRKLMPTLCLPTKELPCRLKLSFSIYFDGTRNNKDDDREEGSHSNIAKLYELSKLAPLDCIFRLYIQGVGTAFKEIGEPVPHPDGAKDGTMGDRRIRYAMLFIANRVGYVANKQYLVHDSDSAITHAVKDDRQFPFWREHLNTMLVPRIGGPSIEEITLDLFGFSRGATAARSFLNQLFKHFGDGESRFCGIPVRVRFMGLFDTVASVGFADAYPLPVDGHQDWGDAPLLTIPSSVEQCVHMVAAHENRASFPVDLVRGPTDYAPNCMEIVYPGMHADVGGGYGSADQGKGSVQKDGSVRQLQADKLSQIALNDMYRRARRAGVPLLKFDEMDDARLLDDFAISPELQQHFDAYMAQLPSLTGGAPVTEHLLAHRLQYLSWRKHVLAEEAYTELPFVRHSGEQEKVDLIEANQQLRKRIEDFANTRQRREFLEEDHFQLATPLERGFHLEWQYAPDCVPEVAQFLEQYVHDSRAHFVLTDPQSKFDHKQLHQRLKKEDAPYQQTLLAYPAKQAAEREAVLRGEHVIPTPHPVDPLDYEGRVLLELYEQGLDPVFTDARPGSRRDNVIDAKDLVYQISGRRENWSYLRLRQVFAVDRVDYLPVQRASRKTSR